MAAPLSAAAPQPSAGKASSRILAGSLDETRVSSPRAGGVAILDRTGPGQTQQSLSLLADRLRWASLLLAAGYWAFLLRSIWRADPLDSGLGGVLFVAHASVTFISTFVGWRLCTRCPWVLNRLRLFELLVFGGSAIFFAILNAISLTRAAAIGHIPPIVVPWMLLIFTYALYIPNTWRRAALVLVPLACIPITLWLWALAYVPQLSEVVAELTVVGDPLFEIVAVMMLSAVIAVWGSGRMQQLREEAFEAQQLGQYRLKKRLGSGGMGEVFLAEHLLLKRPCALKLIRPEKAGDPHLLARFEREVQATAQLTHSHTIAVFDYGRTGDGTFYYVMEYLPGKSLEDLVRECGPLPADRILYLLLPTCDALREAHAQGLVHRDLKPANIFAAHLGGLYDVAKLLDFGLVHQIQSTEDLQLTQHGTVTGSPYYLSPEQAVGDTVDQRSDIYALGAIAWFLLVGRPPFQGDNAIKVILAHAHDQPEPPSRCAENVPVDLEQVILKCLAKNPNDRYQTVDELAEALAACRDAHGWNRHRAAAWWRDYWAKQAATDHPASSEATPA